MEEFTSPGCVNCPVVKAMLGEVTAELQGDVEVEEVDITVDSARAAQYGIMSVPALAINGVLKFIGVPDRAELKKTLAEELERDD